ncbi:hypothetical protein BaRGS_00025055 [Batillaria attramentaria]|uniref:Golgin subfamily A member 3 n=1 Tax=Batillaria attramentaria TaxID=370345 RepID=A0ABD0K9F1_9CAEN
MEPFELRLQQVTFNGNNDSIDEGQVEEQEHLDSFSNLVHYDECFQKKTDTAESGNGSSIQDLAYSVAGKVSKTRSASKSSPLRASPSTQKAESASPQHQPLPWEVDYAGDSPHQELFLINPNDYFASSSPSVKVSPESAAAGLRTLSQVSVNTAAVARHLRKSSGSKRRVARTTLTTTALTAPCTMPSETKPPSGAPSPGTQTAPAVSSEAAGGGDVDSSFETVAEALRLQRSVIGNSSLAPVSPEEVAKIVADAQRRMMGGDGVTDTASALSTQTDTTASTHTTAAVPFPLGTGAAVQGTSENMSASSAMVSGGAGTPSELVRIQAHSITREVERTSWLRSKGIGQESKEGQKPAASGVEKQGVVDSQGQPDSAGGNPQEAPSLLSYFSSAGPEKSSGSSHAVLRNSSYTMQEAGGGNVLPATSAGPPKQTAETSSVPYKPEDAHFPSPASQPKTDLPQYVLFPHPQNAPPSSTDPMQQFTVPAPQQATAPRSQQHAVSTQQKPVITTPQQESTTTSPVQRDATNYAAPFHTSTPQTIRRPPHSPSFPAIPQIGPLFPKKLSPESRKTVSEGVEGSVSPSRSASAGSLGGVPREEFNKLLREKLKLEGQLEVLQDEAQTTLQQRAELQAQLASVQLKMKSGQQKTDDAEKASLHAELDRLRSTRIEHEREAQEVQQMLEEKMEELKTVTEDLYQSQDTADKLQVRMKELRDDLQAREVTVQALKGKIAELYVEVQTTLQSKMDADSEAITARNDLVSLVKAKEWYQEQLSTAHEVRAKLQRQLTQLQSQTVSQGAIVERLKMESARLRQQLRESQERALRDKEQLARHLETIQNDMMEREAAFQEIQRERLMIEDTFNTQFSTVEEEKSRISSLLQLTSDLETQLEQAHNNTKKKQEQVFALENEQMDLMKKLTLAQEVLVEKEQSLEEVNQKLIEVESQLEGYVKMLTAKDAELLKLREDKATTEIALKAALQEKESVNKALDMLKGDMGKVEKSFKQMRQELGTRSVELETAQKQQKAARDELDRVAHELDIKARSVESLTRDHEEHMAQVEGLQADKAALEEQISTLKVQLEQAKISTAAGGTEQQTLQVELKETQARLMEAESKLQTTSLQLQQAAASVGPQISDEKVQELVAENDSLKNQLACAHQEQLDSSERHKQEKEELRTEVTSLKSQLSEKRLEFERSIQSYMEQIHHAVEEKQRLETELEMTQRKFELSSVQQKEQINSELQNLMTELEAARVQTQELERQLMMLQAEKDAEVNALRHQLVETQQALQDLTQKREQQEDTENINQQLALELEKERGRIAGLQQSNTTLKEHMKQLEEALAGRESSLVELNSHLQVSIRERETETQEYLQRIQGLELALKKEKDGGRDLRKQIGSKMTENKRLSKQQETLKKERGELQEEVERRQAESLRLQTDLDTARQAVRDHQGELQTLQAEKHSLETELERVKRELADNADRNPVLLDQIQSLEWQLSQRTREVAAAQEQLTLAEQRQAAEMDSLRRTLQDKQEELEGLQAELSAARQEKAEHKSRVSELRSVLKASVQHHKLTKKLNTPKKGAGTEDGTVEKGTQADFGNGVIIPPLPFDMEAVEKLLHDTAVRPLDSKPLDNLSTCLSSLRKEISGLQKQMDVHTTTIHTSTQSWKNVESEVKNLQEVVRSISNTIMDATHTSTLTTATAADTEQVQDSDVFQV